MADYNYINQSIQATCLIEPKDIDSFYNPITEGHTGFAWDGTLYSAGVQQPGPVYASWYMEGQSVYRGELQTFPQAGLILLSKVSLTILDASTLALNLWMQFLLQDKYALSDNWNSDLNGWTPSSVIYADGIVSVIYTPDEGNYSGPTSPPTSPPTITYNVDSNLVVNIDFTQDRVYLDMAV